MFSDLYFSELPKKFVENENMEFLTFNSFEINFEFQYFNFKNQYCSNLSIGQIF